MKTIIAAIIVLMLPVVAYAQRTTSEMSSARARLSLATERVKLDVTLSDEFIQANAEFQAAQDRYFQLIADNKATIPQELVTEIEQLETDSQKNANQLLDLRVKISTMVRQKLQNTPGYAEAKQRYTAACVVMDEWEQRRRLATISDPQWQYAWEQLQSAIINYDEYHATRHRCFNDGSTYYNSRYYNYGFNELPLP